MFVRNETQYFFLCTNVLAKLKGLKQSFFTVGAYVSFVNNCTFCKLPFFSLWHTEHSQSYTPHPYLVCCKPKKSQNYFRIVTVIKVI